MAQRRGEEEEEEEQVFRRVKRERLNAVVTEEEEVDEEVEEDQDSSIRRIIRSEFFKLKSLINGMVFSLYLFIYLFSIIIIIIKWSNNPNLINGIWTEEKDELMNGDSEKFDSILQEFDKLHEQVKKPREQVADAEALLDLTRTLVGSVKSLVNEGVTPSQFVSSLLKHYARGSNTSIDIDWHQLGISVSPIFLTVHGSSTMLGPMENQLKQRSKTILSRKRNPPRSTTTARPQQVMLASLQFNSCFSFLGFCCLFFSL
jgi:hypothetical protein